MWETAQTRNRRSWIQSATCGTGSLISAGILTELLAADDRVPTTFDSLAARPPHFAPRAKRVIFLYMTGGVSHVDSFDPKPQLTKDHGKTMIPGQGRDSAGRTTYLKGAHWAFAPRGECGTEVSDLFPKIADCMDDICVIRSMKTDHINHYEAALQVHSGSFSLTRPTIGSWLSYGLGTENNNLPSVVVLAPLLPYGGPQLWTSDFLPGCHQGTRVVPGSDPIADLTSHQPTAALQRLELQMLQRMNRRHLDPRQHAILSSRMASFETAYGMQIEAPKVFDISEESLGTLESYGLEQDSTAGFAWQCLVARRLAERGVRYVELVHGGSSPGGNWDAHANVPENHSKLARQVDRPIAALLKDLKSRGMLDETLVVWTTEFGRTPYDAGKDSTGRSHQHFAFSSWLAGGGVKAGTVYGATDEYGLSVTEDLVHIHDFHATILNLMGLDHTQLTYRHAGRDFRLTDVGGRVVEEIIA